MQSCEGQGNSFPSFIVIFRSLSMPIYTPGQPWQLAYLPFEKGTFSRGILEIATEDGLLPEGFMSPHSVKKPSL
jgi:hypothetical protein